MLNVDTTIKRLSGYTPETLPQELLCSTEPFVLTGLVNDWPLVKAGKKSPGDADQYIRELYQGETVVVSTGSPEIKGRVFYNEDLSGVNIQTDRTTLNVVLDKIKQYAADENPPLIYVGSTTVDTCLPEFRNKNHLKFENIDPLVSLWLGNQSRIAAHYDLPDNIACVAVGRRRFTLFPPEQLENLYVGPLDLTPAGQSVSLVDFSDPDYDKFPKFTTALKAAQVADLEPGDAIFIPSMWWHHVEALDKFNILINYWWRQSPAFMGPPINVLNHALLSIRDLPEVQKKAWQDIFNHYVFENNEETTSHIPENARGILGPIDDMNARKLRAFLLNRLNR